jgi:hypothetical protein
MTKKSKSEFLQPTIVPEDSVRSASNGQNIRINPLFATITSLKTSLDAGAVHGQKSRHLETEGAGSISCMSDKGDLPERGRTWVASRAAIRSTGIIKRKKNIVRMANPLARRP